MSSSPGIVVVVDSREQRPYEFQAGRSRVVALDCADYTGDGVEDVLRIERKSLEDLVGCVGVGRARFERSLARMVPYPFRYLTIDATFDDLVRGGWRGKITPKQVVGSVLGWSMRFGVVPLFVGRDKRVGAATVRKLVELAARQKERARADAGPSPGRVESIGDRLNGRSRG